MSDSSPLRTGRNIGPYLLQEKIGKGGMSCVYQARDMRSNETVALKVATREVAADPNLSQRFELEYSLAKPLKHRNLVKVLDYGKHDQVPYLAMELVDGMSLAQRLAKFKSLREHEALSILLPISDALTYLHKQKMIHRDIKPANILISSTGQVKLADMGLIKDLESDIRLTRTHMGLGTVQFSSPEQFNDASTTDLRSDIYSLAATIYNALTGEYPFGKGTVTSIMMKKLTNTFDAPIRKLPDLRPSIDAAIRMAMHAEAKFRPSSISEFVALLTGWKKYPPNVQLPGKVNAPTAPAKRKTVTRALKVSKKPSHERRVHARYEIEVEGKCRAALDSLRHSWPTSISDISTTGMCFQGKRRFEPGSVVEIMFSVCDDTAINHLARVRWIKAAEDKSWLHGCEFVNAMTDADLELIFADLMDKTKMK
jgi:serine/threonine protein kinase